MTLSAGEIIDGKYRIVRLLGQGGMGAVYEGENVRIRRRVAIKLLHPAVSSQAESVTRFEREAEAAGRIGSDHICEVLDLGALPDGSRFMVMEFLEGETLGARIKRSGRMRPEQTIPVLTQVLDGLGAAHAAGIIHRDIKPDNVYILHSKAGIPDFVKILDFGVSKFSQLSGDEMNMTRDGAVVGTPYYMSPEQARGTKKVDTRSDIYALGVLLYQATTGQVPFQATTFNELLFKIVLEPAPPPQQFVPDLEPDFAAIIQRAMAREPEHRFQTCAEFKDALLAWLAARPALAARSPALQAAAQQRPPRTQVLGAFPTPPPGHLSSPQIPAAQLTPQPGYLPAPHLTPAPGAVAPTGAPSGSWASASGANGLPVPQTANSWADASGMTRPPRPSKAPLIAAIAAAAALLGGGAAVLVVMSGRGAPAESSPAAQTETAEPTEATPPPTATEDAPPASEAAPPEPPPTDDTTEPTVEPPPNAATSAVATAPKPPPQPPHTTYRPPTHTKPPTTAKTSTPSPKDPGY